MTDLLDRAFGPSPDQPSQRYMNGAHGGRRSDGAVLYASELRIHSGEGRGAAHPAVKAYATEGPGADDAAIRAFRAYGEFDYRCDEDGIERKKSS